MGTPFSWEDQDREERREWKGRQQQLHTGVTRREQESTRIISFSIQLYRTVRKKAKPHFRAFPESPEQTGRCLDTPEL